MGDAVDYTLVGQAGRVELLEALQRQRAKLDACEQRLLHAIAADPDPYRQAPAGQPAPDLDKQWVREEVACAMKIAPQTARVRLLLAGELSTRLRATLDAMGRGELSLRHAQRLTDAVRLLPDHAASTVQARVLPKGVSQTLAQFAGSVRRAVLAADPRPAEQQHRDARTERRVVFTPQDDGMTELWALLPADGAMRLQHRLDSCAEATAGLDERSGDQRRADTLTDLASDGSGAGRSAGPAINITVALSTLLALDEQPGELDGHGPIPATLTRHIAFDATGTWRRLVTDHHGHLLDTGHSTYRPPAPLARHVRHRDQTCTFPGCRRRATRCELDHRIPWQHGGATRAANLHPLCARHHHLKHEAGWQVHRDPNDNTTRWRSPTGHTYTQPPPDPLPHDTTGSCAGTATNPEDLPPF